MEGFDHHCGFINGCIGRRNYPAFVVMIVVVAAFFSLHLELAARILLLFIRGQAGDDTSFVAGVLALIQLLLSLPASLALVSLVLFHIYLAATGSTTRDFVVEYRRRKYARMMANRGNKKRPGIADSCFWPLAQIFETTLGG